MPSYFPQGNTAHPADDELRSLQKIVSLLAGGLGTTLPAIADCRELTPTTTEITFVATGVQQQVSAVELRVRYFELSNRQNNQEATFGTVGEADNMIMPVDPGKWTRTAPSGGYLDLQNFYVTGTQNELCNLYYEV